MKCSLLSFSFYGFNLASSFSPSSVPRQLFVVAPLKCHFASDGVGFLPIVPSIRRWGTTTVIICEESRYGGPGCRSSRARHPCTCAWLLRELRWLSQIGVNGSRRPDPLLRHIGHMVAVSCKGLLRSSKSKFECSRGIMHIPKVGKRMQRSGPCRSQEAGPNRIPCRYTMIKSCRREVSCWRWKSLKSDIGSTIGFQVQYTK